MNKPECPECKATEWEEFEPYCEDCGNHAGFRCKGCGETVDHVWDSELYDKIEASHERKD